MSKSIMWYSKKLLPKPAVNGETSVRRMRRGGVLSRVEVSCFALCSKWPPRVYFNACLPLELQRYLVW